MTFRIFILWTIILIARPQDFFFFLAPLRPAFMLTILMLVISFLNNEFNVTANTVKSNQAKKFFLLYFIMIIGVPFSVHRGRSFDFIVFQYLSNVLYFYFFIVQVSTVEKLKKILFVICASTCFYAAMSLINSSSLSGRFAYGAMYDPNDFAYFLISLFPLSLFFLFGRESNFKKIIAALTIGLSLILITMTGSRGGGVGLFAVLVLLFFTKFGLMRGFQKIVLFIVLVLAIVANSEKIDIKRYMSIIEVEDDYNITQEAGRVTVWKRGIDLSLKHPLTGVGPNCFPVAIGYYREKLGVQARWQGAHNSYLMVLTELGIFGFSVFILMIFSAIKIFFSCSKRGPVFSNSQPIEMMSRVIFLAFIGSLICGFFLSQAYSIIFTLFFSFSVVVQKLCRES